jgi:sugar phosphate isomerase/epimerase
MKLGFFTAILPDLSLEQVIAFAAREKFSCLEVACWPAGKAERKFAGITHIDVDAFTKTRADDVNDRWIPFVRPRGAETKL